MAKVLQQFVAGCVSVEPATGTYPSWSWRQNYIGLDGWLNLCVSEQKRPGEEFLYFHGGEESDKDWWLRTGYGQVAIEGNRLSFTTKNTRYIFKILSRESEAV